MNKREQFKEELQELLDRYKESLAASTIMVIAQRIFSNTLSILKAGNGYLGFACKIVEEMFPITMPYYPTVEKYKVYTEGFIAKGFEGDDVDYNTICISYVITPENKRVEINRYFGQKDNKMVEINESEYKRRLANKKEKEEK